MRQLLRFLCLALGAMIVVCGPARAQQLPPLETLRAIVEKLPHRPQSAGTTFQPSPSGFAAFAPVGKMQRFTMTLATGSRAARALPVLLDRTPADVQAPVTLMTVLRRVAVDADGSTRAYHPEDPHATGVCRTEIGPDGNGRFAGVCALDNFFSGNIQVFRGTQKLRGAELAAQWQNFWPLIRDKKLASLDLRQIMPNAPEGYYFFYWQDRDLVAFFKREIIPEAADGFPCRHDGYFVAATTLEQAAPRLDNCTPSRFLDAERVPFFVLPDDGFGRARLGDIVVARLEGSAAKPVVYGVVGDTGPIGQLGEASIAFNKALLSKSGPIMNERDADALDISGRPVSVLVLGGTRPQLHGNYSRENIERVGRSEFARWNGDPRNPTQRLDVCVAQSKS